MRNLSRPRIALLSAVALGVLAGGISSSYATGDYSDKYQYRDDDGRTAISQTLTLADRETRSASVLICRSAVVMT